MGSYIVIFTVILVTAELWNAILLQSAKKCFVNLTVTFLKILHIILKANTS